LWERDREGFKHSERKGSQYMIMVWVTKEGEKEGKGKEQRAPSKQHGRVVACLPITGHRACTPVKDRARKEGRAKGKDRKNKGGSS
jgi:hypothetical protein